MSRACGANQVVRAVTGTPAAADPLQSAVLAQIQHVAAQPLPAPHGLAARTVTRLRQLRARDHGPVVIDRTARGRTQVSGRVAATLAVRAAAGLPDLLAVTGSAGPGQIRLEVSLRYGVDGPATLATAERAIRTALTGALGPDVPAVVLYLVDVHRGL